MIVDSHVHVVSTDAATYPHEGPSPVLPLLPVEQLTLHMDQAKVHKAILVQAMGVYADRNDYVLDAARTDASRFGVVVHPRHDGDAAATIGALARAGADGIRLSGMLGRSLDDPDVLDLARAAGELGLYTIAAVPTPERLDELAAIVRMNPDMPVCVDHCAFPRLDDGPPFAALDPALRLAEAPNVRLKVTNLMLNQLEDPRPLLERVHAAVGGDRIIWGSDYPHTADRPYTEMRTWAVYACSRLPVNDQARYLGGNVCRFWARCDSSPAESS